MLLQVMGERAEARWLLEEVVAGQAAQLGPAHIDTLNSKAELTEVGEASDLIPTVKFMMPGTTSSPVLSVMLDSTRNFPPASSTV